MSEKLCVWYVSKYVTPPSPGASGGRGYMLMRELARMGNCCVIITSDSNRFGDMPSVETPFLTQSTDGLLIFWLRTFKYSAAKSLGRILSWLDFEWRLLRLPLKLAPRPNVVIVSSLSLLTVLNGLRLARKFRCRLVFEVRDIWPLTIVEEGGYSPSNPFVIMLAAIERVGYRRADAIVGTMPNLAAHVRSVTSTSAPVHCIPMGVEPSSMEAKADHTAAQLHQRYGAPGKIIVAHVGSIGISNALEPFFECIALLQDDERFRFLVVGDGDLRASYQARFGTLRNLIFVPKVAKADVPSVLAMCDVLYFSTHNSKVWDYGQSLNKVVDYMAAGKIIVGSFSGYPSMIDEAGCGFFVPAGDAQMLRLKLDQIANLSPNERHDLGEKGRRWIIENRSYTVLASLYQNILFPASVQTPDAVHLHAEPIKTD